MPKKYYITTPLYYVNDEPHIGHSYTTILADVLARYFKLFGYTVRLLTGVDEHGQKILQAATSAGREPQVHCDTMAKRYIEIWSRLNINYDVFFRTTNPEHKAFVQDILNRLYEKGDIYTAEYEGWYCTPDERFWTEKDLQEGNCPLCGRIVERLTEKNYFFKMGSYQQWLINWINEHPEFVQPDFRRNEVLGFLRQPLGDLCISRPKERLSWGIPLPFDSNYVTYVWFDALLNYLSATRIHSKEGLNPDFWPADLHLIGKDILTTHTVYWPIMLYAAGYEPPRTIFAHGWWLIDKGKMSKSQGTVVRPLEIAGKYSADAFRYVLMREMTPGQDANFSEEIFINRYNSDLANDLGNLYSRLAKLWENFKCETCSIKDKEFSYYQPDQKLVILTDTLKDEIFKSICSEFKPNLAIEQIMSLVRGLNRQLEIWEPWKTGHDKVPALKVALCWAFSCLDLIATLLEPIMPAKMQELKSAIGIVNGEPHPKARQILFPRLEIESPKQATPSEETAEDDNYISIEDFAKIDLRIAKIVNAERVEGTDKLLKMQIDLGDQQRQIVAGIAQSYKPQELIGKNIVVVANLKPVTMRGVNSQGMLLAVGDGKRHYVIIPEGEVPCGSKVK